MQNVNVQESVAGKVRKSRWMAIAIASLCIGSVASGLFWRFQSTSPPQPEVASEAAIRTVTALGRLQPKGEVIKLSAPTTNSGNRVDRILVQEGSRVKKGSAIAILDNRDRLQAALDEAQKDVAVAQAKLAVTQTGAKKGEIAAQQAEIERLAAQRQGDISSQIANIARLTAQTRNAQTENQRYQSLYENGAISASERDSKRLNLETAQERLQAAQAELQRTKSTLPSELNAAQATLNKIAEVRPVDVAYDRAEVEKAIAARNRAKAELAQAYVRSPVDGEVLYIHTRSGEVISNDGIVEIGQTGQMEAIAEVYQSDVNRVHIGQKVRVSSDSLPGELSGTVTKIGSQVRRQEIINTDPSTNIDARVVEVYVALDAASSQKAAKFTNLQVKVVIEP
ncbi:ABC exporter membrane fusion protein [Aliterella atlantica]|uniref:ABC transporter permease n=1 Tax=Aliterella atlantica CENA595 TaxID=1618023 RepID=A0A0D8ZR45_9CYAN|nr:ABC exporter membrane fusion protein [Aliterella atlantica]KJH71185.1 ABC transporter permease [Aliterella atlantica CENA595]